MALPQPLHIFRKDLRHLWPETLIVVALYVAFAATAPSGWSASPYLPGIQLLSLLIKLLLPISWLVLIARLIHDEPLVGDRQFWTSRPYHWASLLASKLLYLAVFLYVPFFLMQVYLLKHAGLYPSFAIPALLHNLLLLTVIIVIPLIAIAAVTGTFARMLLSSIGALLYVLALAIALAALLWGRMIPPALEPFTIAIFILLPAIALVYQYATRKTTNARWMLLATPLVIFLLLLLTPARALINAAYPTAGSGAPVLGPIPAQFARSEPEPGNLFAVRNVDIAIPAGQTGGDEKNIYLIDGAAVTVGGNRQPYMASTGTVGGPAPASLVQFTLPKALFAQVRSTPQDLHVAVTADHLTVGNTQQWRATLLPFSVPGHGICNYPQDTSGRPVCHFPLAVPDNTFVSAPLSLSCAATQPGKPAQQATAVERLPGDKAAFSVPDFDPVVTIPLDLQIRQQLPPGVTLSLCPGTFLSFVHGDPAGRARFEFDQKQLILDNYAHREPDRNAPAGPAQ